MWYLLHICIDFAVVVNPFFRAVMAGKKYIYVCEFWGHDCTHDQEQNGSPSAFCQSLENENDRQAVSRKVVEIQKFCFHGNVAFLLSLRKGTIRVGN